MKEDLAVEPTIAEFRPTATGTGIGIVVSLEREFDAPFVGWRGSGMGLGSTSSPQPPFPRIHVPDAFAATIWTNSPSSAR